MILIGLTSQLRSEAERRCGGGFRAWMAEARNGTWGNWAELLRHYPLASRTDEDEAHFPLATDGTGIRAAVHFKMGSMRLRCLAPAPGSTVPAARRQNPLSYPTPTDAKTTL